MKHPVLLLALLIACVSILASCHKGPVCPAYNSVHNSKNYAYNPNNTARAQEDNKKDIEKRKDDELKGSKSKRRRQPYSLFPKGVR